MGGSGALDVVGRLGPQLLLALTGPGLACCERGGRRGCGGEDELLHRVPFGVCGRRLYQPPGNAPTVTERVAERLTGQPFDGDLIGSPRAKVQRMPGAPATLGKTVIRRPRMRTSTLVTSAALLSAAFIGVLLVPGVSPLAILLVSNGGQLLAAALASAGCGVAAARCAGHRRRAWAWLAVGNGAWAAGQIVWSYYEVVLDREVPFPSLSDVGFLIFPLAAAVGLLIWLGTQGEQLMARGRDVLDGTIIAGSLLVLSWVTTLGSIVAQGDSSALSLTLSLAYPIGDLILATLSLIALARGTDKERTTLALLALGLGGLAFSDSLYVYLVSLGRYTSADLASSGWVIGFLFVAVSGLSVVRKDGDNGYEAAPAPGTIRKPSTLRLALPYVPLLAAGVGLGANPLT